MKWKQYDAAFRDEIQTDGCLFFTLLSIAEDASSRSFEDPEEIELAYQYAMPNFMLDGGEVYKNRCFINNHPAIIRIGLHILGIRKAEIGYLYRSDLTEADNPGSDPAMKDRCQYFAMKIIKPGGGYHHLRSTYDRKPGYNPGRTENDDIVSLRGYRVEI